MDTIKFTHNWNKKLTCTFFTTLRLENKNKYKVDETYEIRLMHKGRYTPHGHAQITEIRTLKLHQLNNFICGLDSGYSIEETVNLIYTMYKNSVTDFEKQKFFLILLKRVEPQKQATLF